MSVSFQSGKPIPFDDFAGDMAWLYEEAGRTAVLRNAGNRRTESRRALFKAIEDAGGKW